MEMKAVLEPAVFMLDALGLHKPLHAPCTVCWMNDMNHQIPSSGHACAEVCEGVRNMQHAAQCAFLCRQHVIDTVWCHRRCMAQVSAHGLCLAGAG